MFQTFQFSSNITSIHSVNILLKYFHVKCVKYLNKKNVKIIKGILRTFLESQ